MDTLFFIASKLVWALVRPESLLILCMALSLSALLLRRLRLAAAALSIAITGFVTIGFLPIGSLVAAPLEQRFPAAPPVGNVAGIIILGGGEDGAAAGRWHQPAVNEAGDRFLAGIALARRFPEARVLFTGGSGRLFGSATTEADIAADILLSAGIAADRLILEGVSRNTDENARFSRALVPPDLAGTWLLVTSAFHMPRAVATFCAAGWSDVTPWPTDFRSGNLREGLGWNLSRNLDLLNVASKEWLGILAYRLTGRATNAACAIRPR